VILEYSKNKDRRCAVWVSLIWNACDQKCFRFKIFFGFWKIAYTKWNILEMGLRSKHKIHLHFTNTYSLIILYSIFSVSAFLSVTQLMGLDVEFSTCNVTLVLKRLQILEHFRFWISTLGLLYSWFMPKPGLGMSWIRTNYVG
jgi:hypothetical protein